MMRWILGAHRLAEFIQRQGGADDQLFGGFRTSPCMDAIVTIQIGQGRNDYRFALDHAHLDRLIFWEEVFRSNGRHYGAAVYWQCLGSGHPEARIVYAA